MPLDKRHQPQHAAPSDQHEGQDFTQQQAKALLIFEEQMPGCSPKIRRLRSDDCLSTEERDTLKELSENYKLNARQVLHKLKGPFAAGIMPTYPKLEQNEETPWKSTASRTGVLHTPLSHGLV